MITNFAKKYLLRLTTACLISLALLRPFPVIAQNNEQAKQEYFEATITKVLEEKDLDIEGNGKKQRYQKLEVNKIGEGGVSDPTPIIIENGTVQAVNPLVYHVGEKVIVMVNKDMDNKDVYFITDYVRRDALVWLTILFVVVTLAVARKRGLYSILGMVISFAVIFKIVLPLIAAGVSPYLVAVITSVILVPITFYLSHGVNIKTTMAIAGTFITLLVIAFLSQFFIEATKLTGFASEEAGFLQAAQPGVINIKGLIYAGIIIGALGILDDITISQAAVVDQMHKSIKNIPFSDLFQKGMAVGRDHIASMVNTLVLVYTGAALPLLLLFIDNPRPYSEVINYEIIAEEIVRTLIGSIGLVLAVPITTFLAALYFTRKKKVEEKLTN